MPISKSESDVGLFPGDKGEMFVKKVGMFWGQSETLPDTVHVGGKYQTCFLT